MKKLSVLILFIFAFVFQTNALERLPITEDEIQNPTIEQVWGFVTEATMAIKGYDFETQGWPVWVPPYQSFTGGSVRDFYQFAQQLIDEQIARIPANPDSRLGYFVLRVRTSSGRAYYDFVAGEYTITDNDLVNGLPDKVTNFDNYKITPLGDRRAIYVPDVYRAQLVYALPEVYGGGEKVLEMETEEGNIMFFKVNAHENFRKLRAVSAKVVITHSDNTQEEFDLLTGEKLGGIAVPTVSITMVPAGDAQQPRSQTTSIRTPQLVPQVTVYAEPGANIDVEYKDSLDREWIVLTTIIGFEGSAIHIKDTSGVPFRAYRAVNRVK